MSEDDIREIIEELKTKGEDFSMGVEETISAFEELSASKKRVVELEKLINDMKYYMVHHANCTYSASGKCTCGLMKIVKELGMDESE